MGLIGFLVCFGSVCNAYADTEFMPDELLGNPPAITKPGLPDIFSGFGSEFTMKFVTPAPDIDFEIGMITPNPDIDYKIRIAGPKLHKKLTGTNNRSGEITRKIP